MRAMVKTIGLVIVLTGGCLLAGCGGQSIHIKATDDICRQNVRVDVVGVTRGEKNIWEALPMQEYWSEGNRLREGSIKDGYNLLVTFSAGEVFVVGKRLTAGKSCEVMITGKDPVWKDHWKRRDATHFLVMFDTCSNDQKWRRSLPLSAKCWRGRRIDITLAPSGVEVETAQKKCKE